MKIMRIFFSSLVAIFMANPREFLWGAWGGFVAYDVFINNGNWGLLLLGIENELAGWIIFLVNLSAVLTFGLFLIGIFLGTPLFLVSEIIRIFKLGLKADKQQNK